MSRWILLVFLLVSVLQLSAAQETLHCCTKVDGSCRLACVKISLVAVAVNPKELSTRVTEIRKYCSQEQELFWACMNETIQDITRGANWSGRLCCSQAWSSRCQTSCARASSRDDLKSDCRQSDEIDFFGCLTRQEDGDDCCLPANSKECRNACAAVFRSERTPDRETREAVREACAERSPRVHQCVKNHTKLTPAHNTDKYLHCCERSDDSNCTKTCLRAMRTMTTDREIVDTLRDGGCGDPMGSDMVWACFMQTGQTAPGRKSSGTSGEVSRIDRTGIDSAKLICCSQASSGSCYRLCRLTFFNDWNRLIGSFYSDCLSQPSEERLVRCITEVEEPCELGCDGLSFCTNLNHRPTQLFRSCSRQFDEAAQLDVALRQQQGFINMSSFLLPMRNISQCSPETWKAVACVLHTKPCHPASHISNICYEDCLDLLNECVDDTRLPQGSTPESLCSRLSPQGASCISLQDFMQPNPEWVGATLDLQVTSPCRGDPCNESQVCVVNRNCPAGKVCPKYSCVDGCRLGDVSKYVVPQRTYMRLPVVKVGKNCFKICHCSAKGVTENCSKSFCYPYDSCMYGSHKINHSDTFYIECNQCSCNAGEITCSKKHCGTRAFSSLPCNCPPHHMPVCGKNGNTYPSACLAKCAGLKDADFKIGPCSSQDPCDPNPCGAGLRCVPSRQVCLSLVHNVCPQFECVDARTSCKGVPHEKVCDTDNQEHPNLCFLVQYNKRLAYKGPCLANCKLTGVVCGTDGQNHLSECAALAARVAVDYEGPCQAVGLALPTAAPQCGATVRCRPLAAAGCAAATPPGSCCPACGGALRLLVSQKQADRAALIVRKTAAFSVAAVLDALERLVQTAECRLLGHLTIEADIFVQVRPISATPSALQLAACVAEAEKLAALVQTANPRLLSQLSLSLLTAAAVVHEPAATAASAVFAPAWPLAALLAALLVL
ncbi:Hypothetical predicted protein [Cloeon dipterum]|uniref:Reversion-inducing cysteine-rich protein with Kazal motifs n=1 Tax=Cloeon dipterum TaxID=197152 RepID=A0A8S1DXI8_9INSE|nr:Hypothetical predicted protein [Cloeon dipterum]